MRALIPLSLLLLLAGAAVVAQQAVPPEFAETVPVRTGDRCIVCGVELESGDRVYIVRGQRVGVKAEMEPELFANPDQYLSPLTPRGWLAATDTEAPQTQANYGWLAFGGYMLLGLAFAAICAARAVDWGRPAAPWLLAGLFGNVFAFAMLLAKTSGGERPSVGMLAKRAATVAPLACPECGAENHPSATGCSGCGTELEPARDSDAKRLKN